MKTIDHVNGDIEQALRNFALANQKLRSIADELAAVQQRFNDAKSMRRSALNLLAGELEARSAREIKLAHERIGMTLQEFDLRVYGRDLRDATPVLSTPEFIAGTTLPLKNCYSDSGADD